MQSESKHDVPSFIQIAIGSVGSGHSYSYSSIPIVYGLDRDGCVWRYVDATRQDDRWKRLPTERVSD